MLRFEKLESGEYQARQISSVYQRAAKRLGIDLNKPITDEERRELEDEVSAVLED